MSQNSIAVLADVNADADWDSVIGEMKWESRPTCWMSLAPQGGPIWHALRTASITASNIHHCLNDPNDRFAVAPTLQAEYICGLKAKPVTEDQKFNMNMGSLGENIVREWDEKRLGKPIRQVGIGVWKQDPIFRGSMDGELDGNLFVEYKIPKAMYWRLIEYLEAVKKGFTPPGYDHIFISHYDQMIANGVIHNKEQCKYTVVAADTHAVYEQWIPIDYDHWYKVLYPGGLAFYRTYVEPLMRQHNIRRIDPPSTR